MEKKANRKSVSPSGPESALMVSNTLDPDPISRKKQIGADQGIKKQAAGERRPFTPGIAEPEGIKHASVRSEAHIAASAGHSPYCNEAARPRSFDASPKSDQAIIGSREKTAQVADGKEWILFVDDEEVLVIMVETMLRRLGYGVVSTTSSAEALRLFKEAPGQFDMVITDYTMPYLTGLALAKKLLTIRPDIPIILCTGFSEGLSEETAKKAGIKNIIQKPLVRREMMAAIQDVLDETA